MIRRSGGMKTKRLAIASGGAIAAVAASAH